MSTRTSAKASWAVGNTVVIVLALVPVVWLASLSFKDPSTIADGSFLPHKWTLANYRGIFQTSLFTRALVNSIGIAADGVTHCVGHMQQSQGAVSLMTRLSYTLD